MLGTEKQASLAEKVGLAAAYMVVGPSLIFANKHILTTVGFPFPVLLSSLGLLMTTMCTHIAHALGYLALPNSAVVTKNFYLTKVLPIGALHAATIAFGNAQYLYLGVAVIQFCKAFTPFSIALMGYLTFGKTLPKTAVVYLLALVLSTVVSVEGDATVSFIGLVLAAACSTTDALRLTLQEYLLQDKKFGLWEGLYFFAPAGGFFLFTAGLVLEGSEILDSGSHLLPLEYPLHFLFVACGGLGVVALNTAVVKATSAVTLKSLAIVRNGSVVVAGIILYNEVLTVIQGLSYVCSVVFFVMFQKHSKKPEQRVAAEKVGEDRVLDEA